MYICIYIYPQYPLYLHFLCFKASPLKHRMGATQTENVAFTPTRKAFCLGTADL